MSFNKRVFILEDDPARIAHFREVFHNAAELTIIESCTQLAEFKPLYDAIFLDHDLGTTQLTENQACAQCGRNKAHELHHPIGPTGSTWHPWREDCGAAFVELIKHQLTDRDIVIVHSYNAEGAKRMLALLPAEVTATYAPFRGKTFDAIVAMLLEAWRIATPVKGGKKHA